MEPAHIHALRDTVPWASCGASFALGRRSKAASSLLRQRGIRSLSLRGGIRDWPYAVDTAPIPTPLPEPER